MEKIKAEGYDPGDGHFNPKTGTGQNTRGPEKNWVPGGNGQTLETMGLTTGVLVEGYKDNLSN